MKKFRRVTALLMAMIMVLAMGVTSFAAENTTAEGKEVKVVYMLDDTSGKVENDTTLVSETVEIAEDGTVKDAMDAAAAAAGKDIQWGFDSYSDPNGYYMTSFDGIGSEYIDSFYSDVEGESWYESNDWIIYQVGADEELNVTADTYDNPQALSLYASNVQADSAETIYVVYQYTYTTW